MAGFRPACVFGVILAIGCGAFPALDDLQGALGADGGTDALQAPDAGPADAPVVDAADAGSFCARHGTSFFCADFDENPVGYGWSGLSVDQGTASLDDAFAVSPPHSARITRTTDGCNGSELVEVVPGPMKSFHLEAQVRPTSVDAGIQTYLGGLFVSAPDGGAGCALILDQHAAQMLGLAIQPTTAPYDYKSATRYPIVDQWTAVAMDVSSDPNGVTIQVSVGGQVGLSTTVTSGCGFGGDVRVALGPNCSAAHTELRFDDVLIDKK